MYFIQYTHQQLCRYVVNTTQIYTVHSSAALQLDCVFSLSVNPLHFTGSGEDGAGGDCAGGEARGGACCAAG